MLDKVREVIEKYGMLCGKNRVIVALSGGADSMCLLNAMQKLSEEYNITIEAAHVNHCLRGEESERDNDFVRRECRERSIVLYEKRSDVGALAAQKKQGLEECGREVRYAFFAGLADENTVIATAHTASDNAETVLLNITRGCGIDGLTGIPAVRGNIIRPLLLCTRSEIEHYCADNGIPFVTDSTNLSDDYARNKIRLNVLPELMKINPNADVSINRLSSVARTQCLYINDSVQKLLERNKTTGGFSLDGLRRENRNILPSVIKKAIDAEFMVTAEKRHSDIILKMIDDGYGAVQIRKKCVVKVKGDVLAFEKIKDEKEKPFFEPICPEIGREYRFFSKKYIFLRKRSEKALADNKINKKLLYLMLKCDILSFDTVLRQRQSGDVFRPYGRNCTKSVKKLFTELKIPEQKRDKILLLARGHEVLWIEGIGTAENAVPDSDEYIAAEVRENDE